LATLSDGHNAILIDRTSIFITNSRRVFEYLACQYAQAELASGSLHYYYNYNFRDSEKFVSARLCTWKLLLTIIHININRIAEILRGRHRNCLQ